MGFVRTAFGVLSLLFLLSGCSTTDALTPQVDVGGGLTPQSNPVTENDLQRMAQSQQPVYPPASGPAGANGQGQVYGGALPPAGGQQNLGLGVPGNAQPGTGAPPTTLQQQAAVLGQPTAQNQRLATPAQPQPEPQQETQAQAGAVAAPVAAGGNSLRFLPIIGAPLPAVTPLSRQLGAEARARGIAIKSSGDTSAQHVLKGYFSCVAGGGTITVTYVWDVLDSNGGRLNRIQGQESFAGNASDPWSAVPASVMQNIATKTMDSYTRWRAGP